MLRFDRKQQNSVKQLSFKKNLIKKKKEKTEITLPTKVHLFKAMVFPVVMYGCESWTIKKGEHQRMMLLHCGVGEDS